jgi:hypothetical protein
MLFARRQNLWPHGESARSTCLTQRTAEKTEKAADALQAELTVGIRNEIQPHIPVSAVKLQIRRSRIQIAAPLEAEWMTAGMVFGAFGKLPICARQK